MSQRAIQERQIMVAEWYQESAIACLIQNFGEGWYFIQESPYFWSADVVASPKVDLQLASVTKL